MRTTARPFVPVQPGEAPGDPELGGWRPLPARSFALAGACLDGLAADPPSAWECPSSRSPSLQEAVRLVAQRVNDFTLRSALSVVAARLRRWEESMAA